MPQHDNALVVAAFVVIASIAMIVVTDIIFNFAIAINGRSIAIATSTIIIRIGLAPATAVHAIFIRLPFVVATPTAAIIQVNVMILIRKSIAVSVNAIVTINRWSYVGIGHMIAWLKWFRRTLGHCRRFH